MPRTSSSTSQLADLFQGEVEVMLALDELSALGGTRLNEQMRHIGLLAIILGQQARKVELKRVERGWYTTEPIEGLGQKKLQHYLVATRTGPVEDKDFRENFPRFVRIAALDRIKDVVTKNVPGLRVAVEQFKLAIPYYHLQEILQLQ
jgi:predicted component of type VI protein secretion system